ncbi:Disintegrin and metallo ase domain-containing 12 [Paramuricea clavata]|uniref:Disintegrin and metallo ase domain-containing 12 n=1 Tax=Paramuricea clavata TaxID=317549 RepID=A0A6S7H5M2_PARCT|nr:Disintegrin and metallo ase domain-containing 12 [Paramuricea clavata]
MAKSVFFCFSIQAICVIFTYGKHLQKKDQQFIDSLQQYEFVEPKLSESFTVHNTGELPVEEKRLLSFRFQGQTIKLQLTPNRNLLSPNFFERHVTTHGYKIVNEAPRNCYFHGHVERHKDTSIAAISSCDGFEGYFTLEDKTFSIQPVESLNGEVLHIVFESEHANLPEYKCGHSENGHASQASREAVVERLPEAKHRVRRDVLSETKYVELVVVNDVTQYKKYGSETSTRAIVAANFADATYRVQNIRVVLTMIEIWKDVDQIVNSTENDKFLNNFIQYKINVLDTNETTKSDHAVLITQRPLQYNRQGWAGIGTICSPRSASLVYDTSTKDIFGAILAHELGHSFGFDHIETGCSCRDSEHRCLMNSYVSGGQLKWSNCTEAKLRSVLERNYGTCLFNQPTKRHNTNAECQNGFIDDEEECDCGTKEECERMGNHCCNYTTCKLHPGSECDVGPCCQNCKIKSKGLICRDKVNDCDLPEYCDGKSQVCGPDTYVHNGRPCSFGQEKSLCYFGVCHTYDNQCKSYWGADAYHSEFCYNNLNVRSDKHGCCKLLGPDKYMKCARKDVLCGKLQCRMSKEIPYRTPLKVGHHAIFAGFRIGTKVVKCWSVNLRTDDPDSGIVETGSMCGENKVCSNNTCLDVKEVYGQPECPNNCSGNGICNNLGHCHCNPGYGCLNCSEECDSEGGSVDSGNNCYCPGPTTAPKTTEIGKTTRPQTTHETPKSPTEPIATTSRISEEPTEPIATTSRISEGGESTDEESTVGKIQEKFLAYPLKCPNLNLDKMLWG